eukprot:Hpha_TRINITY_DN16915_c2_g1::TRINITY_DN16915_c2_g1_i1::g.53851::m.53851/K01279/TPP1, CLN2; tripeptidyl-peptidase I
MLAVAAVAAALTASGGRVTMEAGASVGSAPNWKRGERCVSGTVDALFMMRMSQTQAAELESTFWAVSEPDSPRYGKHLSREQLRALVGASESSLSAVHSWLAAAGVKATTSETGDSIRASVSCTQAESLFATQLHHFHHTTARFQVIRAAASYSLPADIAQHVQMVGNILALPRVTRPTLVETEGVGAFPSDYNCGGSCGSTFTTPKVLTERYSLGSAPTGTAKGSMAVAEFQGVYYDDKDLSGFGSACGINVTVDIQVGANKPTNCEIPIVGVELCAEALLDIQYIKSVGGSIPLTDIFDSDFSLLNWMTQVLDMSSPPLIHSVSYGNDEVQQDSAEYMMSCNQQFQKAGARGVSVLFASGDQGVLGRSGGGSRYHPDFPAGSPYITAVGGTDFVTKSVIGEEKAWTAGGGGFSDTFAIPSFQTAAVAAYKTTAGSSLPAQSYWNNTGRGYPDVAALGGQGNPYCVEVGGKFRGVAGTSASCPVVAGVFAKLNEVRLARGDSPLGFLNPLIYKIGASGQGFNDVTQGRNCGKNSCTDDGFPAVKGWDAATGWGTPNFAELSKLV